MLNSCMNSWFMTTIIMTAVLTLILLVDSKFFPIDWAKECPQTRLSL